MAERNADSQELRRRLEEVLAKLPPAVAQKYRDRLQEQDAHFEKIMADVGQEFEYARQRIREIEAKAFAKLRHPSRSRRWQSFVEEDERNQQ